MTRHHPQDVAVAHFKCGMDNERLLSTPANELALAMGSVPRGQYYSLSTVYVIGNAANNLVKIGYADNLRARFSGLNCGSPVCLQLLHFVHVVDGMVAKLVEGKAHLLLAEHRRKGEWFEVDVSQAAAAIGAALATNKIRWWTEYERRRLPSFAAKATARHEQHQRIFGT